MDAFLIGRHEVTNKEFLGFIGAEATAIPASGPGHRQKWPGRALETAAASLVDRTGVPGPRFWSAARIQKEKPIIL